MYRSRLREVVDFRDCHVCTDEAGDDEEAEEKDEEEKGHRQCVIPYMRLKP